MFEFIYDRAYHRNEALARHLNVPYTREIHKAYKQNLKDAGAPVCSLSKVILDDVYDRKLVGFSAGPLTRYPRKSKTTAERNKEAEEVEPALTKVAEETPRFQQLKELVTTYTDAFSSAVKSSVVVELKTSLMGIVNENKEEVFGAFAKMNLHHEGNKFNPCWFNPKGFGWRFIG